MADFSSKIIVSDFDGTLYGSDSKIPERNIEAIKRFTANGGKFAVATGRVDFVLASTSPEIKELVNAPSIMANGSFLYDYRTDKRMYEIFLDKEKLRQLFKFTHEMFPEAGIRCIRGRKYVTPNLNDEIRYQMEHGYMENVTVYDLDTIPVDGISKVAICMAAEKTDKLRKAVSEVFSDRYTFVKSSPTILEVLDKKASKGNMLDILRRHYEEQGIKLTVYAVGDYENDMEMLSRSDVPCCPSNSLDCVKAICDVQLVSNDEGAIGDLVERIEAGKA